MTACDFMDNMLDSLEEKAESAPKAEEMMLALAENRTSAAKALMHPEVSETADKAIDQMSAFLAGRKTSSMELASFGVSVSAGVGGKSREERVDYEVTLTDGTVIYIDTVYLSNHRGAGFTTFQLNLGAV